MESLGFDLKYFLFQLANFVLLFILLRSLLHKPLRNFLESRQKEISDGLTNAEKVKEALADAEVKQQELLEKARGEARKLIETSRQEAKDLGVEMQQEAAAQATAVLERAQDELQAEREKFRTELKAEMADLVVTATKKILDQANLDKEKQQQIEKLVKEVA